MKELMTGATEKTLDIMNPMPISGLGTIIGRGAKSFDDELVNISQKLIDEGASPMQAVKETGYFKDWGGNWKSQISDEGAELKPLIQQEYQNWKPKMGSSQDMQLGSVLKHSELFYEYPWMATKIQVRYTTETKVGSFKAKYDDQTGEMVGGVISINPRGVKDWQKKAWSAGNYISETDIISQIINHETNHAIQAHDIIPGGATKKWFKTQKEKIPKLEKAMKGYLDAYNQLPKGSPASKDRLKKATEIYDHISFFKKVKDVDDGLLYRNTLGEADAFWSQDMMKDPDVMSKLPIHYDPTKGRQRMMGSSDFAFEPKQSAIVSPQSRFARGIEP